MYQLKLSNEAKEAIKQKGLEAPDTIDIILREATLRERMAWEADQSEGGRAHTDGVEWVTDLVLSRVKEPYDREIIKEAVLDMAPSQIIGYTQAYITGEVPDPKLLTAAISKSQNGLLRELITRLSAAEI